MNTLLSLYYERFKKWFWFILCIVFESGAASKFIFSRPLWEVLLNAITGVICLLVFIKLVFGNKSGTSTNASKNGRLVFLFTVLGAFAGAAIIPYMTATVGIEPLKQLHLPFIGTAALIMFQVALISFIASAVGLKLAATVGLDAPFLRKWLYERKLTPLSKKWILISIVGSFLGTIVIVLLEVFVFQPNISLPAGVAPEVSLWKGFLAIFYGGIVEELLLRLFLMTLLVWLLSRFQKSKSNFPSSTYWIAIVIAAVLFGLGHLPATASMFGGLTPLLVIRAILSNGLLGIFFGYLYWKKGLEYAMISHLSADFFLHVVVAQLISA